MVEKSAVESVVSRAVLWDVEMAVERVESLAEKWVATTDKDASDVPSAALWAGGRALSRVARKAALKVVKMVALWVFE